MAPVAAPLPVAVLAAVHKENQRKAADAQAAYIAARAKAKASADELARAVAMEAKAKMRAVAVPAPPAPVMGHRRLPKAVAKKGVLKVVKEVKQKAVMGRPKSEGCTQCARLARGLKGGHSHTCGKVAYSHSRPAQ